MADVNYIITIDDRDALKALSDMKVGFNSVGTAATQAQQKTDTSTKKIGRDVNNVDKEFKKASSSGLSFWKLVGGSAVGNLASQAIGRLASGIIDFGKGAIKASAEFEQFRVVLTNSLGSGTAADMALSRIEKFAAETPFSIQELTAAFVQLANRGITPSTETLTAMGDLASALGKPLQQVNEAVLDVTNSERWTELGIKVKVNGDKITGTFRGMTVSAERSEKGALQLVEAFGKMEGVAGGMAEQAKTLNGQISNLKDKFAILSRELGDQFAPAIKEIATGMSNFLGSLDAGTILAYFAPLKDTLLPAIEKLFIALSDVIKVLSGADFSDTTKTTNDLNEAFLVLVDTLTFIVDVVREVVSVIGGLAKISGLTLIIKQMKQGFEELGNVISWVNGLFGTNAEAAQNNALAQAEAKKVMDILHKTTFEGVQLAIDNLKVTKDNTKATIDNTTADKKAAEAKKALESAIESLNEKVRASNTAQLEGFELIKAENKNALDDIDALQKKLEGLAKTAGKTLSQEVKNGLNELRQNVNENTAKEVNDLTSQIIGNAIKSSGEIYGEQLKKQQEGIENLKEGINKYYDFLEEDEVRRVGLINSSTDENLTLEEYREREILKIRLRYAQIRLNLLQNDNTTEGAARKKQAQTDIDLFQNELNKAQATTKKEKPTFMEQFLIDQFGIDESEAKKAITTAANTVSTLFNGISNLIIANTQMEIERNQKLIDSLTERVEKSKELLEIEYDNAARGSTNLLQLRQTEYDKIRIQQEQALEKQEQLRKKEIRQKLAADNLQQGSSLITSSANIIQAFSPLGGVGLGLAAVSIAAMIALFIKTRAQAYELANESAYTGGPMTQFLNGKSDRDGQRAYVVVDENGKSVLNLGGNETIMNPSASSTYKGELAAMNKGVYKHRGVGEVAENRALSIGQKQTEIVQMREQMNYEEMKRVFGEVMIGYHEDYKKYNDKKEVFIPTKDGYISKKGLHTKKVRI